MKSPLILLALLLLTIGGQGCVSMLPEKSPVPPGTYKMDAHMATSGYPRKSLVHIPSEYTPARDYPLLIMLHGAFSTAREMEEKTGFSALADREGFLVLYPEGIGILGFLQHWNAGHCCGKAEKDAIDDMGFLDAAIDQVQQRFSVNPAKIFMVGHSNGGMLVHLYAAKRPRKLAGIAVVSGTINSKRVDQPGFPALAVPQKPLPVCMIHGVEDDSIPYTGGAMPDKHEDRQFASMADAVDYWVTANKCAKDAIAERLYGGRVKKNVWDRCHKGARVTTYAIENWKHAWPGRHNIKTLESAEAAFDFDAGEIIWAFFATPSTGR
jgi:polyhydroxybutyrate depolymerase